MAAASVPCSQKSLNLYYKAEELKKVTKKSLFRDANVWQKHYELLEICKKLLLIELEYALEKKTEVDLWNYGFKDIISQLQSEANTRSILDKNKKSEAQANLAWFLDFSSGFYVLLLQELCVTYDLDLPFMRSASYYGVSDEVVTDKNAQASSDLNVIKCSNVSSINYICAHCLVHLGDIARYRGQSKQAENFYRHSLKVAPASGHSYNQLALLEVTKGNYLNAIFFYVRALGLKCPFPAASSNLSRMYAKVIASEAKNDEGFVGKFLKFEAYLHSAVHLKKAAALNQELCESLTDLVASESLKTKDLLKCISIILFHIDTNCTLDDMCTFEEKLIRRLQLDLLAGMINALLLPVHTVKQGQALLDYFALPLIKIILDWILINEKVVNEASFMTRQQIWSGLEMLFNDLSSSTLNSPSKDEDFPLPEEFDLQAFLPISERIKKYNFRQILKGSTLSSKDVNVLRATRILEQGRSICEWKGRRVLTFDEGEDEGKFKVVEDKSVSSDLIEAFERELNLAYLPDDEEVRYNLEKEEDDNNGITAKDHEKAVGGHSKKSKNVAMAAILRQATSEASGPTQTYQERQVTFKTPSPNLSEDSGSQISQEDVRTSSVLPPPYMMKAPQRPMYHNPQRSQMGALDFSVPPPPIFNQGPRFDMPPPLQTRPSWPLLNPPRPVTSAEVAATFGGPSYSLFSGSNPTWSLPTSRQEQNPPRPPQPPQTQSLNQQNFLFQPGPSPLEKLLQQNPNAKK